MTLLRIIAAIIALPFNLFAPVHTRRDPGVARTIYGRGLGPHERDAAWIDKDGDWWRFNAARRTWEYTHPDAPEPWIDSLIGESDYISAAYAPYRELIDGLPSTQHHDNDDASDEPAADLTTWAIQTGALLTSADGAAVRDSGPAAEDSPRPGTSGAAVQRPGLGRSELLDASYHLGQYAKYVCCPASVYVSGLADRLREQASHTTE